MGKNKIDGNQTTNQQLNSLAILMFSLEEINSLQLYIQRNNWQSEGLGTQAIPQRASQLLWSYAF